MIKTVEREAAQNKKERKPHWVSSADIAPTVCGH